MLVPYALTTLISIIHLFLIPHMTIYTHLQYILSSQLIAPPMNTRVVSLITSVAGPSLNPYLSTILTSLLISVSDSQNSPNEQSVGEILIMLKKLL